MNHRNNMVKALFLCMATALCMPGAAISKAGQTHQIESITVTAEKRKKDSQDVPISMSLFNEIQIEDAGIMDMKELTYFTPNAYAKQNASLNTISIRGLSTHNCALNPPAGLFVDGISYPITFMQNPDLVDIERIEILKGPQGTLYGRNTESGVINIHTKQPDNTLRGKVFSDLGMYDTPHDHALLYRFGGSISGPVVNDRLFMGISFQTEESDDYIENVFNGENFGKTDHKYVQGKLRWTPTERLDISMLMNANENEDFYNNSYISGPHKTERYKINWDRPGYWEEENNGQAVKVAYSGDTIDLVSITARNAFEADSRYDVDFSPVPMGDMVNSFSNTMLSQDFRVSSAREAGPFEWLFGLFGFKDENDIETSYYGTTRTTDYENQGFAVYGQATYTLMDRIHLTAGLRYEHQDSDGKQINSSAPAPYSKELEYNEVLPKVSLSYDLKDDFMCYATVAKGFLAGGYDYAIATGSDNFTFGPEYTWNYEAGVKSTWLDQRLMLNATVFYIDIKDKQIMEYSDGKSWHISNAAEASSKGLELELTARPAQGLHLYGGLGVADAKIDQWISGEYGGGNYDYKDKKLPTAPVYTYNLGVKYLHHTGIFGRIDLFGTDDIYTDPKNTQKIQAYNTVNLRFGFQGERFDVILWAKNVFDKDYLTNKNAFGPDAFVEFGQPRSLGLSLAYRF